MLTFGSIFLFSENPGELSNFYKQVFEKDPEWSDGSYTGFNIGGMFIMIGPHDKVHGKNTNPERIMVNFNATDVEAEFSRIKNLGATVIATPYHPQEEEKAMIATFADPDGNYFQLNTPWEEK